MKNIKKNIQIVEDDSPVFRDVFGNTWKKRHLDKYNTLTAQIEAREAAGMDCEALLNGRHNFYMSVALSYK